MRLHKNDAPGPPCKPMEPLLHRTADGSAGLFTRLYATAHAARCLQCGAFLHNLEVGLAKMRGAREKPPEEAMARLEERLAAAGRETEG